jgi:hypothetical protein
MQYRSILFILFSLATFITNAQLKQSAALTNLAKINLFNPGVSFEKRINSNQTLYLNTFYNLHIANKDRINSAISSKLVFEPSLAVQYRFYYNIPVRKTKMNSFNSYNYVCPAFETNYGKREEFSFDNSVTPKTTIYKIGALWGIQRNYKNHFSVDANVGLSYITYKNKTEYSPGSYSILKVSTVGIVGHVNIGYFVAYSKNK